MKKTLLIILLILLTSCSSSSSEMNIEGHKISCSEIFLQRYNKYMVLLYKTNCIPSRNTLLLLKDDYKTYDIVVFLVETYENGVSFLSSCEGNTGITEAENLQVCSVPTLLIIENKCVKYELNGFESIRDNYLFFYFK